MTISPVLCKNINNLNIILVFIHLVLSIIVFCLPSPSYILYLFLGISIIVCTIILLSSIDCKMTVFDNYKLVLIENFKELSPSQQFLKIIPKILYINLEKRNDRKRDFLSNFQDYDTESNIIERIDAVDTPENGRIGCLKSHIKALKYALTLDLPYILITEDDFYIKDMNYAVNSINTFLKNFKNWDVLMLGINKHIAEPTDIEGIIRIKSGGTASGYLVKKNYIPKIISIYERDLNKYNTTQEWSDEYCVDVSWVELQKVDLWYSFTPSIGIQRPSYSDIEKKKVDYQV